MLGLLANPGAILGVGGVTPGTDWVEYFVGVWVHWLRLVHLVELLVLRVVVYKPAAIVETLESILPIVHPLSLS